jgi:hypothetical protein
MRTAWGWSWPRAMTSWQSRAARGLAWRESPAKLQTASRNRLLAGGPAEVDERGLPDLRLEVRRRPGRSIQGCPRSAVCRQIPSKDRIWDWSPPSTSSSSPPSKGLRCPAGSRLCCNPPPGTSSRPGICRRRGRPQARWNQVADSRHAGASVGVFPEPSAGVFTSRPEPVKTSDGLRCQALGLPPLATAVGETDTCRLHREHVVSDRRGTGLMPAAEACAESSHKRSGADAETARSAMARRRADSGSEDEGERR